MGHSHYILSVIEMEDGRLAYFVSTSQRRCYVHHFTGPSRTFQILIVLS